MPRGQAPMTTTIGKRYKSVVLQEHIKTDYHKECERLCRLPTIEGEISQTPLKIAMDKANTQMMNHVAKLMIEIFVDGKQLNQSAHSWPARHVTNVASSSYDLQNRTQSTQTIPENIPMQYVNKPDHLTLLTTITNSYLTDFMKKNQRMLGGISSS